MTLRHFFPKWTAEGAGNCGAFTAQYSATWGHTSVAGDVLASRQVHGVMPMKSGWHRGYCFNFIRPGQKKVSSAWGVFLFLLRQNEPGEFLFYREGKAMKIRPTLDEVKTIALAGGYDVLPVSCEILADICTPIEALKILKNVSTHCYLLESAQPSEKWGRYTFLGLDPKMEITCQNGRMKAGELTFATQNPSQTLQEILAQYKSPRFAYLPPFTGGLVGYFSYDYLSYSEPKARTKAQDTENFKDVDLMLFDQVIAFDNLRQKIVLIVNMPLQPDALETNYNKAILRLNQLAQLLQTGTPKQEPAGRLLGEAKPLFDKDAYCAMVEKAKHAIHEGEIFQIVLSNRLAAPFEGSLLGAYRMLRTINPSPYMFYFSGTDVEVAGASPETLVKLEDSVLHTFPLAGTRPPRQDRHGGQGAGSGAAGGRKGTGRAQYAGRPWSQRSGQGEPLRHCGGGKAALHRAVFPCDAHRLHRARSAAVGMRCTGRHRSSASGRHSFRCTQNTRLPADRRTGKQQARHLRRCHRLH